ncbi:4-hydroxy-3-methylbut-2-enyl diphosphate reductase [Parafannyhessea umbonata]|uniref:4-hydroxy-3-methylbut-2-enyl diphosphate reductase n=1 Tax=Parafannyhessea umbonata TaxID=604330 RepID=A0A1H9QNY0_9ACTN|nr:4-hydroxy-3-methylbut-2-enyl diphosphate reductase [Parafannyhessea umbonata]SER61549.1 4-hydroxy-3-methylbut-2-enyl diphosphate reductase [Parafannyhessea umbonata]
MPRIVIASEAGACYGVNRALELVRKAAANARGPIHTLGPLIHNPKVVGELEASGVSVASAPDQYDGGTLVLRTHGVTPAEEELARSSAEAVLDATCPFVVRAHRAAETLTNEGYDVLVFGEPGHPEVLGTLGHAPGATVVQAPEDLEGLRLKRRVGLVVQTTQSRARLRELVSALIGRVDEVRVMDTICEATSRRQAAAARLAAEADVMVVVGGRVSANTCRLAQICLGSCSRVHHIEDADELQGSWFAGAQTIGVTAGASTPQDQIDHVVRTIGALTGGSVAESVPAAESDD